MKYLPHLIWSLLIGLMAADVITTTYLIQNGGQEGNVFMIGVVSNPLYHVGIKLILVAIVLVGYFWLEHQNKTEWKVGEGLGLIPVVCCCPIFAWAVGNNLSWIIGG